jgi:hypothetical protein
MKNELETFKTLFEQVRGLGIVMQLPNDNHIELSRNIKVYFAGNYNVTSISFGRGDQQVEIMKYSTNDSYLKVSLDINSTEESLQDLIQIVNEEYRDVKIKWYTEEIETLKGETV